MGLGGIPGGADVSGGDTAGALGVLPIAVILPLWQRQQIQQMQTQSQQQQTRLQQQFQSWQQDCLTSQANSFPQPSAQAALQGLRN